jgi:hypothetical protein
MTFKDFYNTVTGKVVHFPAHLIDVIPNLIEITDQVIDPCEDCHAPVEDECGTIETDSEETTLEGSK